MGEGKNQQQIEMNEASHRSVEHGGCVRGNAQPFATFINPGINKALPPHVGLSRFDSLGSKYSGGDGSISEHMHVDRVGRDLLLLGLRWVHAGEKFRFGLNGEPSSLISTIRSSRIFSNARVSPSLYAWFQAFSKAMIFD